MNIKSKILFLIGLMIVMTLTVMIFFINVKTEKLSKDLVFQVAQQTANRYSKEIESLLGNAIQDAQVMEIAFWEMKLAKLDRRVLDDILIKTTQHDPKILGTWMLWEPNAYDSKDKEFANTYGHDSTGRVNSYWHWEGDIIINEPNQGWETSTWYNTPKNRKKETLIDPYIYKVSGEDMLLISAVQPIMKNGKFHGVVGVDIKLDTIQKMIGELQILEVGYSSLIANNGTFVAHPDSTLIGKNISTFYKQKEIAQNIKIGQQFENIILQDPYTKEESYLISVPINVANLDTPWALIVSVPVSKINAPVNSISNTILLIGGFSGIIMLLILLFVVRQFMNPIDNITKKLTQMVSKKDEHIPKLEIQRKDEVGELAKSFNVMADNLNHSREELILYKNNLEKEVAIRTQELARTNEELEDSNEELQAMIHNLKTTQDKLIESEKMASLGGLVAGVAHEINTPIGIGLTASTHLSSTSGQLKKKYEEQKMTQEEFESYINEAEKLTSLIESNLKRTSQLVKNFKQVAVDQTSEDKREFKLKEYTKGIIFSLDNIIKKKDVNIEINCDKELTIDSYPGFYSQILTNLLLNSFRHGFKDKKEGNIIIDIFLENEVLNLSYEDDGVGIAKENISKIFDPFFTTNRESGGTGLGLNIIYNIITNKLNGTIKCIDTKQKGAKFVITFKLS